MLKCHLNIRVHWLISWRALSHILNLAVPTWFIIISSCMIKWGFIFNFLKKNLFLKQTDLCNILIISIYLLIYYSQVIKSLTLNLIKSDCSFENDSLQGQVCCLGSRFIIYQRWGVMNKYTFPGIICAGNFCGSGGFKTAGSDTGRQMKYFAT